ncbi:MAG TPA: hypothetical protein VKG25_16970 [Bryobacteraceae bacterium]|nr:hypothetical protein [Bryobacteraceae bacterium]
MRRQTVKKRLRSKLQAVRQELRERWHEPIVETGSWLRSVAQGYFNYHAVAGEFRGAPDVPAGGGTRVAGGAPAAQSTAPLTVGALSLDYRSLAALAANLASGTGRALRRQYSR